MAATSQPSSSASFFLPVLAAGSPPPGDIVGDPSAAPPGLPLDSNGVPILPHELKDLRDALPIFKAYAMFWLGIILWDTLATFPIEYRFVWKSKWSILKVCYLLNRYWTPLAMFFDVLMITSHVSEDLCGHIARFNPASGMISILACGVILSVRIYALWDRSKMILATLVSLLLGELAMMLVGIIRSEALVIPPPFKDAVGFYGCIARQTHGLALLFWAASLAFETIALALLVWRILVLKKRSGSLPILRILLRHGVFYFSVVFVVGVVNIIFFAQPRVAYQAFNAPAAVALMSLMASRLVLALHDSKDKLSLSSHTPTPGGTGPRLPSRAPTTAHSRPNTARGTPLPKPGPPFTYHETSSAAVELGDLSGSTLGDSPSPSRRRGAGANLPRSSTDEDLEKGGLSLHWVELPSRPPVSHTQSATYRQELATSALDRRPQTTSQLDEDDERPTSWSDRILSRNASGRNGPADVPRSASFERGIVVRQETTVSVSGIGEHGELEKDDF
ncbi:hypothetical protein JCM10213_002057 [Rhodosporidiobolus nylandii]